MQHIATKNDMRWVSACGRGRPSARAESASGAFVRAQVSRRHQVHTETLGRVIVTLRRREGACLQRAPWMRHRPWR